MKEISNQTVSIHSDKKGNILLRWPDLQIFLNIENTKLLIKALKTAVQYEENIKLNK